MSRSFSVFRVDVFTGRALAGNPAAAVLDAQGLSDADRQAIAGELRVPGTAFVSRPSRPDAQFALRTFTPAREVAYSGHTSLGAVRALIDSGRFSGSRLVFETARELLPIAIEQRPDGTVLWLEPPTPAVMVYGERFGEIQAALGLGPDGLATWAPLGVSAERDLLVPIRDLDTLRGLAPDLGRLGVVAEARGLRGICAVSLQTVEPASSTHARFFAPHYGLPEDIVTGSVHSAIAVWLYGHGQLGSGDRVGFTAEQGDILGRPGRLSIEIRAPRGNLDSVRVGGQAVAVLTGRLRMP